MKKLILIVVLLALPVAALSDQNVSYLSGVNASLGIAAGKTIALKTGTLTSTATTADQVLLTYTVTSGKTFYVSYFDFTTRLTTYAATATNFGNCSLESPAGTKLYTQMVTNAGASVVVSERVAEPIPIASGVVVRLVCTPSAVTSFTWVGNFGGYEK